MSSEEDESSASEVEEEVKKKRGPKKGSKKAAAGDKKAKKGKKTEKKKKDPNAPKRPLSAFMYYSQKQRPNVKKENPTATFAEVAKILGEQWKALDASLRKEYDKSAADDKKRFEKQKAAYEKGVPAGKDEDDEEDGSESDE